MRQYRPQQREYYFVLINLDTGEGFEFRVYPEEVELTAQADWKEQGVTGGTKPLLYSNNEPDQVNFPKLWLDNSASRESLTPQIKRLKGLTKRAAPGGAPPALLASWGDDEFRCVLREVRVRESYFDSEGRPLRAEVSLSLVELQEDRAPAPAATAGTATPIPSGQVTGGTVFGPEP